MNNGRAGETVDCLGRYLYKLIRSFLIRLGFFFIDLGVRAISLGAHPNKIIRHLCQLRTWESDNVGICGFSTQRLIMMCTLTNKYYSIRSFMYVKVHGYLLNIDCILNVVVFFDVHIFLSTVLSCIPLVLARKRLYFTWRRK